MADRNIVVRFLGRTDGSDGLDSTLDKVGSGLAKFAVVAAGAGAAVGAAFVNSLNIDAANDKLQAQLGLTREQAKQYGKAAGEIYSQGWGDSLGTVNEALKRVTQDIGGSATASAESLKGIAQSALIVADTFDQDLGGVTRAVGNLMRNGLAPDAQTALDIVTKGLQTGVDKSDDFLDTLNEYGTKFRDMGLDAQTATGLLSQGLQAGARDADVVADSIKEFSIRAIDGSKTTVHGFEALGLSASEMQRKIGAGGAGAASALDLTLDKLRAMHDPVQRDAIAVELFGTQAEDLGDALFALDPSAASAKLGEFKGATNEAGDAISNNALAKIESFKRGAITLATEALGTYLIPAISGVVGWLVTYLGPSVSTVAGVINTTVVPAAQAMARFINENATPIQWISGLIAAVFIPHLVALAASATINGAIVVATWVANGAAAIWSAAVHSVQVLAQIAGWVLLGTQALIQGARIAAGWVLAMGPIGWVTAAVIALAALIIANWDWISRRTSEIWGMITGAIGNAVSTAGRWVEDGVNAMGRFWGRLQEMAAAPVRFIVNTVWNQGIRKAWNFVVGLFGGEQLGEVVLPFAEGGSVRGRGTGTSDSIPALLSNGEHVWTADEVRNAGGHGAVEWMRNAFGSGRVAALAGGGPVWQQLWDNVRGKFPAARLTSSYRPGDPGFHGRGEAIDVAGRRSMDEPYMRSISDWIRTTFPRSTELIHTPGINLKNGRPFNYSAGVRNDHRDHVHWAMSGGEAGIGAARGNVVDMVKSIVNAFLDPRKLITDMLGQFGQTGYGKAIGQMGTFVVDKLMGTATTKAEAVSSADPGGASVERWRAVVQQALTRMGLPLGLADTTLRRMNQESGGNPRAINNWDSNAKRGIPSKGLMQVIDPTFAANRDRGLVNDIWDPMANIVASMRYALGRYGSLSAAYDRKGGYSLGGLIPGPRGASRPILAHGGEFVVSADLVDAIQGGTYTDRSRVQRGGNTYVLQVVNAGNSQVDLEEQFARMEMLDGGR